MPKIEKSDIVYGLIVAIILVAGYGALDAIFQFFGLIFQTVGL